MSLRIDSSEKEALKIEVRELEKEIEELLDEEYEEFINGEGYWKESPKWIKEVLR